MERYIARAHVWPSFFNDPDGFLRRKFQDHLFQSSPELEITDLGPLSPRKAQCAHQFFAHALPVGMCASAWFRVKLSATVRIRVRVNSRHALSCISQYAATPCLRRHCLGAYNVLLNTLQVVGLLVTSPP